MDDGLVCRDNVLLTTDRSKPKWQVCCFKYLKWQLGLDCSLAVTSGQTWTTIGPEIYHLCLKMALGMEIRSGRCFFLFLILSGYLISTLLKQDSVITSNPALKSSFRKYILYCGNDMHYVLKFFFAVQV